MSESSTKRPPHTPAAEAGRAAVAATAATEAATAALPVPRVEAAFAAKGNPAAAMPNPAALFDAFAHGAQAYAEEMAGLMQTGFATATDTATAMLGAKTPTEAFEINAGFVQKSLDTMLTGSVRLTDITARLAEESLRPLMPAR